jgi:hypothetical protein
MGRLFDEIRQAVHEERFLIAWHADERCEERAVSPWQLAAEIDSARLVRERPSSKPNPSVVVHQTLADGSEVECIWAWLFTTRRAKLVTVYFPR